MFVGFKYWKLMVIVIYITLLLKVQIGHRICDGQTKLGIENCTQFYKCSDKTLELQQCQKTGWNYDPTKERCIPVNQSNCTVCGGDIIAKGPGVLCWPVGSEFYDQKRICRWNIDSEIGFYIKYKITFMDIRGDPKNCSKDYIDIHGKKDNDRHENKYCGTKLPDQQFIANTIAVEFFAYGDGEGKGFKLTYDVISTASEPTDSANIERIPATSIDPKLYECHEFTKSTPQNDECPLHIGLCFEGVFLLIAVIIIICLVIKLRKNSGVDLHINNDTTEKAVAKCDASTLQCISISDYDEIEFDATNEENHEYDHFQRVVGSGIQSIPTDDAHHYDHVQRVVGSSIHSTPSGGVQNYDNLQRVVGRGIQSTVGDDVHYDHLVTGKENQVH